MISKTPGNHTIKTTCSNYIYCDIKPILFEEQNATIIILNDITQIINMQNQKHEQKMVEMLVATSTHEMRTPLHCIKNTLQMLQDEKVTPNEFISRAIIACDMQECYINDMLDFAKFKKDSLVIVKEHICVNELLNEVGGYFTYTAKESNIYLNVLCPNDSIVISADYTRLKQVLFNLISNAFKFTQTGGITLIASVANDAVKIEVKDTGIGIKQEDLKNLFEAFGVIESSRKYNKSGTGLGLFLCKQLCSRMDTEILVDSLPNVGSTFTLIFKQEPYAALQFAKGSIQTSLTSDLNRFSKDTPTGKALVVDDNGFNCRILEKMLEGLSVGSYKALNGQLAMDLLKSKDDIIIAFVDLNMPIMDGFELIKLMKSSSALKFTIPIYALTGDSTDETKEKCEIYGFNGCLIKPFTKDKLKELLIQHNVI
jgi:CheY-like chemotaxis protein/nitrogen-specific signal transduction histidine kinase